MSGSPRETMVEGDVERVTFENVETGFRVIKLAVEGRAERLAVIGNFPQVPVGSRVRVRGTLIHDKKHGEQLKAESVTELLPSTLVGIERYLASGMIKGIGEGFAKRIVGTFGLDTLRVLDEAPERLHEVGGLGKKRIEEVAKTWNEQRVVREVMVFLQAHGASVALAARIFKRYGKEAIQMVSSDPYRLALDVWGIGFKTADRIAKGFGIEAEDPARLQAGVFQTLHDLTEAGHVDAELPELVARAGAMLELNDADAKIVHAVRGLAAGSYVVTEMTDEGEVVFPSRLHAAEVRLADRMATLATAPATELPGAEEAIGAFEDRSAVTLASAQREAVREATKRQLMVITGGPGVGKTTIVRAILAVFEREGLIVRLAAPTGRAAKRLAESTGREASTLHRLLDFDPKRGVFKRDAACAIEGDAVIVDEASMIDLQMADALAQGIAVGTRLILVGDVDQLPSVGPGAVLRDLIASRTVPCVRLTHIFRQAEQSLIVKNAHLINRGEPPTSNSQEQNADFYVIERRDAESAKATILELVTSRIPRRFGLDSVRDVQVLTPMHRGPAGTIALNEALQAALNPPRGAGDDAVTRGTKTFRVGDKVMQLRNDYDRDVWNGDIGIVTRIDREEESIHVRYDEEREIAYEPAALDQLTLSYASSIHKSQGSEYPAVVIPLLTTHFVMLSRNLLYTAVTRGKRLVVLVADPRALSLALAEDRRRERRTRLEPRLIDKIERAREAER